MNHPDLGRTRGFQRYTLQYKHLYIWWFYGQSGQLPAHHWCLHKFVKCADREYIVPYPIHGYNHDHRSTFALPVQNLMLYQSDMLWQLGLTEPHGRSLYAPLQHRSEEHTSELQSRENLVCRLLLEK